MGPPKHHPMGRSASPPLRLTAMLLVCVGVVLVLQRTTYMWAASPVMVPVAAGEGSGEIPTPLLGRSYQRRFSKDLGVTFRDLVRSSKVITILGCNNPWLSSKQVPRLRAMVMCVDSDCGMLRATAHAHQQAGRSWQYYCLSPRTTGAPTNTTSMAPLGIIQYTTPLMVPDTLVMMQPHWEPTAPSVLEAAALLGRHNMQTILVQTMGAEARRLLVRDLVHPEQPHTLYSPIQNELGEKFAEVRGAGGGWVGGGGPGGREGGGVTAQARRGGGKRSCDGGAMGFGRSCRTASSTGVSCHCTDTDMSVRTAVLPAAPWVVHTGV